MTSVDAMTIALQAFDQIALFGALIAVGLLTLAAQRYFANRRRSSNQEERVRSHQH
jgi:HAMP domain-containing protein